MQQNLQTPRLLLRPPRPHGDAPHVFERWASRPALLRYLDWVPHTDPQRTHNLLNWDSARWHKRTAFTWLLLPRGEASPDATCDAPTVAVAGPCDPSDGIRPGVTASMPGLSDRIGPIGQIQLEAQRPDGRSLHHLRLGYVLGERWQGQGLMLEAARAVLAHALAQPGVWRIDALCDVENTASQRLLEALGMVCEGRLTRRLLLPQLGLPPRDAWLYASNPAPANAPHSTPET